MVTRQNWQRNVFSRDFALLGKKRKIRDLHTESYIPSAFHALRLNDEEHTNQPYDVDEDMGKRQGLRSEEKGENEGNLAFTPILECDHLHTNIHLHPLFHGEIILPL